MKMFLILVLNEKLIDDLGALEHILIKNLMQITHEN